MTDTHSVRPRQPKLGVRNTRQREAVVRVLQDVDKFISARFIHDELKNRGEKVGLTTVYRTLQSLTEVEAVDVLHNADGETLYRHCLTADHHHHLVCIKCGRSEEIQGGPVEQWARKMAEHHGYSHVGHEADVYGVCQQCQAAD
ncbi:Fur family transcriptional regulator [Corynebacterium mayonis]|uniref:Fur family transcriptional regulator n=1 Tax=Corynebacterium mayonis TaxID=3062461 RepID=UPI003140654F